VQLAAGDSNCPAGGAAITDAAGATAYVCNGRDGADGQEFAGSFTSPNGEYAISVTNDGIVLSHGSDTAVMLAGSSVTLLSGGLLRVQAGTNVAVTGGGNVVVQSGAGTTMQSGGGFQIDAATNFAARGGSNVTVQSGAATTMQSGGATTMQSGASFGLSGSHVQINGGSACPPAARLGDGVAAGAISSGSSTVCIG
jgi:hypothetical protein